jgi:cbb3-type cytochrome oxidase subunit 3
MFRQLHMVAAGDPRLGALLLFFIIFLAVLARSFLLHRGEDFAPLARLPLEEDDTTEERAP